MQWLYVSNNDLDHQHRKNMSSWAGDNIQLGFSEPWLLLKHRGEERKTANYTKWLISDTWNMRLCCDWSGSFVTSSRHRDFRRHQRRTSRGWEMTHWTLGHQLSTENSAQNIWRLDGKMNVISLFFLALLADLSYYYIVWQLELIHVKTTRYHIKQLKRALVNHVMNWTKKI